MKRYNPERRYLLAQERFACTIGLSAEIAAAIRSCGKIFFL
jgi:hypothetical protein